MCVKFWSGAGGPRNSQASGSTAGSPVGGPRNALVSMNQTFPITWARPPKQRHASAPGALGCKRHAPRGLWITAC